MDTGDDILSYLNLDPDHHEKIAALIPKETWYEVLIRYGLYIGAVFQMICILAVILLPSEPVQKEASDEEDKSRASSPTISQSGRNKQKKKSKKKLA